MITNSTGGLSSLLQSSSAATPKAKSESESLFDEIKDKGFSAYAKEVQDKKMEELRKKILGQMGLSEEDLNKMPAEQRAAIEKIVAQEMQKRLSAQSELNKDGKNDVNGVSATSVVSGTPGASSAAASASAPATGTATGNFGSVGLGMSAALLDVLSQAREDLAQNQPTARTDAEARQ